MKSSNFIKSPSIKISSEYSCFSSWNEIRDQVNSSIQKIKKPKKILVIECYHGVSDKELKAELIQSLQPALIINATEMMKGQDEIEVMTFPFVTDDRIFGFMSDLELEDYFHKDFIEFNNRKIDAVQEGIIVIYGIGASIIQTNWDQLIYADMPRWEIQQRMRRQEVNNIGMSNKDIDFMRLYKQGYFVDWRVCDRQKRELMDQCDFILDTTIKAFPKMVDGATYQVCLSEAISRPFSVVPFFDPGPWGGQWMKEQFDLDGSKPNFAWCFNCVPEENSLYFQFGDTLFETPAINLLFERSIPLLGESVYEKFGAEFPIRFDFLDTMGGGNLSLQVHPTSSYIREHFGMGYTQDESYYFLDADEGAISYLGLKEGIEPDQMIAALQKAQKGDLPFDADQYVASWPIKKHDHLLIPSGTVHCQGKNSMVLEISATPYIFTFKLWDWGRLGLDGKPRPINIDRGAEVIQWDRDTPWTEKNLVKRIEIIEEQEGWREERTGLHETEFIETRRHWFKSKVEHDTKGTVNVINLVEGREAIVESPEEAFEPFLIHYAETFIVPATIGRYTIRPYGESIGKEIATIKAYIRD